MTRSVTSLSQAEALRLNPRWSEEDRRIVARELERLADRNIELLRPPSGGYIRVVSDGETLMYIGAGFVGWYNKVFDALLDQPSGTERRDESTTTLWLSTHEGRGHDPEN